MILVHSISADPCGGHSAGLTTYASVANKRLGLAALNVPPSLEAEGGINHFSHAAGPGFCVYHLAMIVQELNLRHFVVETNALPTELTI